MKMATSLGFWTITLVLSVPCIAGIDLRLKPREHTTVWEGDSQELECEVTLMDETPDFSWRVTPQSANYTIEKTRIDHSDGSFTHLRILTLKSFSSSDAGAYICTLGTGSSYSATESTIRLEFQPICPSGKYGMGCTSSCNEFCTKSETESVSPCHYRNGTCLFGCENDHSGPDCSNAPASGSGKSSQTGLGVGLGVGIPLVLAIVIAVTFYCRRRQKRKGNKNIVPPEGNDGAGTELLETEGETVYVTQEDASHLHTTENEDHEDTISSATPSNSINAKSTPPDTVTPASSTKEIGAPSSTNFAVASSSDKEQKIDMEDPSELSNEFIVSKIRHIFVDMIDPISVLEYFHKYDAGVLTTRDKEEVTAKSNNHGAKRGASELLDRLSQYHDWFPCLMKVLRDSQVKLPHVAATMERAIGL